MAVDTGADAKAKEAAAIRARQQRKGMSLYSMKGTRDWDATMWYKGGFRAIALPKVYVVDKNAREAAIKNKVETWDQLSFFSTNDTMTVYHSEIMNTDPEYKDLLAGKGVDAEGAAMPTPYADAKADQRTVEREMAGRFGQQALGQFLVNTTEDTVASVNTASNGQVDRSRWSASANLSEKDAKENPNAVSKLIEDKTLQHDAAAKLIARVVNDTSLGGNDALNCYWSYNEDDDIVHPQTAYNRDVADNNGVNLKGMGRVYAENIERYQQILYMNFGLPVYKGAITSLFGGSSTQARLINRGNTLFGKLGYLTGTLIKIAFVFPLLPLYGILALCDLFNTYPVSKYFEHRTAMPMYFKFCNVLIGHMAVNLGLYRSTEAVIDKVLGTSIDSKKMDNSKIPTGSKIFDKCNVGTPEILKYGPDMLAIMYRKSLRNRMYDQILQSKLPDTMFETTDGAFTKYLDHTSDSATEEVADLYAQLETERAKYEQARSNGQDPKAHEKAMQEIQQKIDQYESSTGDFSNKILGFGIGGLFSGSNWKNMFGMMMGTALQTIDFIGFKVEKSTSVSESVSNSTAPLEIANTINGMASQGQQKRDSLMGMLLSGRSGLPVLDQIAQFTSGLFGTLMDSIGMGNMVNVLTGNGFADIPERWQSSSFSRSYNVEIQLRARYGDSVSWLQSIGIPLACILAGGMPRGIGGAMYTSPFLVRCYCKGMFSIPTGIIESISMTRGDAEYGWSMNRLPLSLNVQLTIKDLSPILYIGMDNDMNTSLDEYMSTLTGLGLYERTFRFPMLLRRFNRALLIGRNTWANPLWWGNQVGDTGLAKGIAQVYSLATGNGMKPAKNN